VFGHDNETRVELSIQLRKSDGALVVHGSAEFAVDR